MKTWVAKFAYSGCGKREFLTQEFTVDVGVNVDDEIKKFVQKQNYKEAKSDRIRYVSKYFKYTPPLPKPPKP